MTAPVLILMGSDSDLPVMERAFDVLNELEVPFRAHVCSAHRTPDRATRLVSEARAVGVRVIIAGAGMAAHLAGVTAAHTTLPVIGVPLCSGALHGADALHSTVQMPPGIPVATVGIDGGRNAGILAAQILATSDEDLTTRLESFRTRLSSAVAERDARLQSRLSQRAGD